MKTQKKHKQFLKHLAIGLSVVILSVGGCSSPQSEKEAEKLIQKQTEALETQQEAVEETFNELSAVK
ncbi:MAG: hypothetical protein V5A59_04070, partial [Bacteroidales bacterium]